MTTNKIHHLDIYHKNFPTPLKTIPSPPKQIYILGENLAELLNKPRLAIVGSRRITPYGKLVTSRLVSELVRMGIVIVSGLAVGVDGIAHQVCIEEGGQTIAVLGCGLDRIYPSIHRSLASNILDHNGAIISEYPAGTEPFKQNFIARNRLIAGLADGVLIPEAAENSGSLHTARFALEQGSTVMAVPGNINSPTSTGTNNLIKAGAVPITQVEDIIAALNWQLKPTADLDNLAQNLEEKILLNLLSQGISDGSELQIKSELSASVFNQTLTMLEITGRVRPLGANHWMIK